MVCDTMQLVLCQQKYFNRLNVGLLFNYVFTHAHYIEEIPYSIIVHITYLNGGGHGNFDADFLYQWTKTSFLND